MSVVNQVKHTCSCGHEHTISKRPVHIEKQMVAAMIDVFRWAEEKGVHEFDRKDINHITLRHGSTVNSNWGYVSWLTGIFYHPEGKRGKWGVHRGRMIEFMHGKRRICIAAEIDPTKPKSENKTMLKYATIDQIPHIGEFLDENREFIVAYTLPDTIPEDAELVSETREPEKPIEGPTYRAIYQKKVYSGGGYQKDKEYEITLEKIQVGKPIRILKPIEMQYRDQKRFMTDWKITQ